MDEAGKAEWRHATSIPENLLDGARSDDKHIRETSVRYIRTHMTNISKVVADLADLNDKALALAGKEAGRSGASFRAGILLGSVIATTTFVLLELAF